MDLFSRYVFKQALTTMLVVLSSVTLMVWMATALKQLKIVTTQGQTAFIFFQITTLALPKLMAILAPLALLIACLQTLSRLSTDSETIVMTASGANIWRLGRPYLLLSFIVAVAVLISNVFIMPSTTRWMRELVIQVRTDLISQVLQPGRFSSPEKGLTFHIRGRDGSDNLLGLLVHDERQPAQTISYLAARAQILKKDDTSLLVMFDGQIHRRNKDENFAQVVNFDRYIFSLAQFGKAPGKIRLKPSSRYTHELMFPDPGDTEYHKNPGPFRAELHERLASALYPIVFALIALAALGPARTTREGRIQIAVTGFAAAVAVRGCGLAATNLLSLEPMAVILVYGVPLSAIIITMYLAHVRMRPQRWSILPASRRDFPKL